MRTIKVLLDRDFQRDVRFVLFGFFVITPIAVARYAIRSSVDKASGELSSLREPLPGGATR